MATGNDLRVAVDISIDVEFSISEENFKNIDLLRLMSGEFCIKALQGELAIEEELEVSDFSRVNVALKKAEDSLF